MVRVGNIILIVVLSLGLLAAATFAVFIDEPPVVTGMPSMDLLIVRLADQDEGVSRSAEEALLGLDREAIPYLDAASKSSDPILAGRARLLLKKILSVDQGVE